MEARLNPAFEEAAASKKVPGVAAIVLDRSGDVLYKGVYGTTNIDDANAAPLASNTPVMIWSCTKLVASVAALQLVEQGKINIDDPVEKYLPNISKIQVLDGFKDGQPVYHSPKTKPKIVHLMTHTSGFSYDNFDQTMAEWRTAVGQKLSQYLGVGSMQAFESPFLFEPGSAWQYGISIDWLGFVVEAVSGLPLNEYIDKNILKPLGMVDSGSHLKDGQKKLEVHLRDATSRGLVANPGIVPAADPEKYGGGHYLYSTLDDYSSFLVTILNNGTHPTSKVKILDEKTVKDYLFTDHIPKICPNNGIGVIQTANPTFSLEGEMLPGVQKGWSCGMMMNVENMPKGRSAGSGTWAGLGNLYYWIDPKEGKTGFIMSSVLPFLDQEILHLFDEMERTAYGHPPASKINEEGSNYSIAAA